MIALARMPAARRSGVIGNWLGRGEELRAQRLREPLLVLVGVPLAVVDEELPHGGVVQGEQDAGGGGGIQVGPQRVAGAQLLGEGAGDLVELGLDLLPERADLGIGRGRVADHLQQPAGARLDRS